MGFTVLNQNMRCDSAQLTEKLIELEMTVYYRNVKHQLLVSMKRHLIAASVGGFRAFDTAEDRKYKA